MRFRNIALVDECDDATLSFTATLVRHHRARIALVHVIKGVPDDIATFDVGGRIVVKPEGFVSPVAAPDPVAPPGRTPPTRRRS